MYAAAGGASIARRQARRLQKQQHGGVHKPPPYRPHHPPPSPLPQPELNGRITGFGSSELSPEAALYVREKQKQRRKKIRRGRIELPSNVATKEIAPFPRYPPNQWGRAAWQGERRVSLTEVAVNHRIKATEAHRRWMKRNRIHDSSFGGSSSEDDEEGGGAGQQSAAANALLYVGLGTVAIGLVISFVGTGEKGFKTLELRLIGPTLIGSGLLCCLVRVFLCVCPSRCIRRRHKHRHRHKHSSFKSHLDDQNVASHFNHHTFFETSKVASEDIGMADKTSLLRKTLEVPTVAVTSTDDTPKEQEDLQQDAITSTTLFLQHEQEGSLHPTMPNFISDEELDLELRHLDASSFDISSFDSEKCRVVKSGESEVQQDKDPPDKSGLVNPDPEAHKLEEEMMLLEEEIVAAKRMGEIVLSPSKLQQSVQNK